MCSFKFFLSKGRFSQHNTFLTIYRHWRSGLGFKIYIILQKLFFSPNFFVYFSADVELMTPTLKKSKSKKPKHSPKPKSRKKDDRTETNGDRKTLHEVPAPCSGCGERLETKLLMEKHKKDCSTNNIICSICDKSFRTETQVFYF